MIILRSKLGIKSNLTKEEINQIRLDEGSSEEYVDFIEKKLDLEQEYQHRR